MAARKRTPLYVISWLAALAALLAVAYYFQMGSVSIRQFTFHKLPQPTQRYLYGDAPEQYAELWLPDGPGPHKVVAMIHGGCWLMAINGKILDASQLAYLADDLRRSGYAVWNIEYRRLGVIAQAYPQMYLDIAHGLDSLRKPAKEYNLDLSDFVLVGISAGGHLASWAAARPHLPKTSPLYIENPLSIPALVTMAGVDDLEAYHNDHPVCSLPIMEKLVSGHAQGENPYGDTSAVSMLPLGIRQIIISGSIDLVVPSHFATIYASKAKAAGDKVRLIEVEGADHMAFLDTASTAWSTSKEAILSFFTKKPAP